MKEYPSEYVAHLQDRPEVVAEMFAHLVEHPVDHPEFLAEVLDCVSEMTDMQATRLVSIATDWSVPLPELLGVLTAQGNLEVAKYIRDNFMTHVGSRGFDYTNLIK